MSRPLSTGLVLCLESASAGLLLFCPLPHSLSTGLLLFLRFFSFSNPTVSSERFTSLKHSLAPFAWPGPLSRVCFGRFALAFPISLSTGLILFLKRPSSSNPHSVFRVVCLCVSNIPWPLSTGLVLFLESASAGVLLFLSTFPFPFDWFAPVLLSQIPQWLSSGVLLSLKYSCPLSTSLVLFLVSASAGVFMFLSIFLVPFDWFAPVSQILYFLKSHNVFRVF